MSTIAMKSVILLSAIVSTCQDNTLKGVYVNDKGEIFTSENFAALSVNNDKKRYGLVTLSEARIALVQAKEAERKKAANSTEGAGNQQPGTGGAAGSAVAGVGDQDPGTEGAAASPVEGAGDPEPGTGAAAGGTVEGADGQEPGTEGAAASPVEGAVDQTPGAGADTGTKAKAKKAASKK